MTQLPPMPVADLAKKLRDGSDDCAKRVKLYQEEQLTTLLEGGVIGISIKANLKTTFKYAVLQFLTFKVAYPDENRFEVRLDVDAFLKYVKDTTNIVETMDDELEEIQARADEEISAIKAAMKDLNGI
jgi:hypothetical protein